MYFLQIDQTAFKKTTVCEIGLSDSAMLIATTLI